MCFVCMSVLTSVRMINKPLAICTPPSPQLSTSQSVLYIQSTLVYLFHVPTHTYILTTTTQSYLYTFFPQITSFTLNKARNGQTVKCTCAVFFIDRKWLLSKLLQNVFTDKHIAKLFRALEMITMISTNFSRNPKPVRTLTHAHTCTMTLALDTHAHTCTMTLHTCTHLCHHTTHMHTLVP